MDVRCESCQTEYELEDASVSSSGTPVQCTACGFTFLVTRMSATPPPLPAESQAALPAAEWLLETTDAQFHRFRNLTSLQKWIIERRITRDDKISRTGHAWRRLGEIVELSPFFDVVDDADRARAAAGSASATPNSGTLKVEAERARRASPVAARQVAPPEAGSLGASVRSSSGSFPQMRPVRSFEGDDSLASAEFNTAVVRLQRGERRGWKVAIALVAACAAGVYWGILRNGGISRLLAPRDEAASTTAAPVATAAPSIVPVPSPAPRTPVVAPPPAEMPAPAPAPAAVAAATVGAEEKIAGDSPTPAATPTTAAMAPGGADDKSYARLVRDAEKLLENGATDKAEKLYEHALRANPSGVEAISGLAYVMLDKGRAPLAIAHFKRAIDVAPYGPALFGLAEAYRASGDRGEALATYRRYLAENPSGSDAPAAQRQIHLLEPRQEEAQTAAIEPPKTPAPPTDPAAPTAPAPAAEAANEPQAPPPATPAPPPPPPAAVTNETSPPPQPAAP